MTCTCRLSEQVEGVIFFSKNYVVYRLYASPRQSRLPALLLWCFGKIFYYVVHRNILRVSGPGTYALPVT